MSTRRPSSLLPLLSLALLLSAAPAQAAPGEDAAFAQYRERFKEGLDRYNDGAFTEAIGYWEPIYRELGEHDGYRLAYDLGVAYMQVGDATRAAERLAAFLAQVDERRAHGDALSGVVAKEEIDGRSRLTDLTANKGRIRFDPSTPPQAVKVDTAEPRLAGFVAWVAPGAHTVVLAPGTPQEETRTVTVAAGEIVAVESRNATATPSPTPTPTPTPTSTSTSTHPEPSSTPSVQLLILSGGVTVAATVAAVALDLNAASLHDRFVAEYAGSPTHTIPAGDRGSYDTARTGAYVVIGCAAGLAALTAGLVTWRVLGAPKHEAAVPVVAIGPGGAQVGFSGRF